MSFSVSVDKNIGKGLKKVFGTGAVK